MNHLIESTAALLRARWRAARTDDGGATAIEWAIFALLALAVAGLVAGAITPAINNRLPGIRGAPPPRRHLAGASPGGAGLAATEARRRSSSPSPRPR